MFYKYELTFKLVVQSACIIGRSQKLFQIVSFPKVPESTHSVSTEMKAHPGRLKFQPLKQFAINMKS